MLTSSTIGVIPYTFSRYSRATYSPWDSLIRCFFLSMILTAPFGRISPMSPDNTKGKHEKSKVFHDQWFNLGMNCTTCMKPSISECLSCQFWILVVSSKSSFSSQTYLTTRRVSKRIVTHLWNFLQTQLTIHKWRTNSSKHAHFIWKADSGQTTILCQPWMEQNVISWKCGKGYIW